MRHIGIELSIPSGIATMGATGGVRLDQMDRGEEKKMESPPKLGLETINIAPFVERPIYYQITCSKFRYGDGKVLGIQPHSTRGSASIHCVLRLNLIKGVFNIYHS